MTTTPKTTIAYSLEDILERIENKMDARFEKIDRQFERIENKMDSQFAEVNQRLTKLEVGQAELSGEIKAVDERLSGDIKALDQRLSGNIKTLSEKVDGLGKRLDNQEFLNRGVVVA
ncbi:MAG: DUF4164 domain-containing protein, partial [Microcystaceae cyanobacterium]